jgi:hypothetical protein
VDLGYGLPRVNIHKVQKTLDANKQCTPVSKIEHACSVTKDGAKIDCTISNGIVTVVDATLGEGDTVDLWMICLRSNEGGGICKSIYSQTDEDQWQAYLDAQ